MKVVDKMRRSMAEGKTFYSFEFFPPRTEEVRDLYLNAYEPRASATEPDLRPALRSFLRFPPRHRASTWPRTATILHSC